MEITTLTEFETKQVNDMYENWKKENNHLRVDAFDYIKYYVSRCEYCGQLFDYDLYSIKLLRYNNIVHCCDDCKKIIERDNLEFEDDYVTRFIDYQIDEGLHKNEGDE